MKDMPMSQEDIKKNYSKKAKVEKVEKCDKCGSTDFTVKKHSKHCNNPECKFVWR